MQQDVAEGDGVITDVDGDEDYVEEGGASPPVTRPESAHDIPQARLISVETENLARATGVEEGATTDEALACLLMSLYPVERPRLQVTVMAGNTANRGSSPNDISRENGERGL